MTTPTPTYVNWNSRLDTDPPPDDGPGGPLIPGDDGYGYHAARALKMLLDARARGRCLDCGGEHRTWDCPNVTRMGCFHD